MSPVRAPRTIAKILAEIDDCEDQAQRYNDMASALKRLKRNADDHLVGEQVERFLSMRNEMDQEADLLRYELIERGYVPE